MITLRREVMRSLIMSFYFHLLWPPSRSCSSPLLHVINSLEERSISLPSLQDVLTQAAKFFPPHFLGLLFLLQYLDYPSKKIWDNNDDNDFHLLVLSEISHKVISHQNWEKWKLSKKKKCHCTSYSNWLTANDQNISWSQNARFFHSQCWVACKHGGAASSALLFPDIATWWWATTLNLDSRYLSWKNLSNF